jgi:transcriptional regulator with XRE-family HTH domain
MVMVMKMIIGQRIAFFRKEAGLTQHQLAERADISREAIGNYEKGRRTPPVDIAQRIAAALNMSVDDLIYPDGMKPGMGSVLDVDMEELQRTLDERSAIISEIIQNLDKMNEEGKQKAVEYVRDLVKISEYQRKSGR